MAALVIYQGEVLDPKRYEEYIVKARESILAAGGRFIARGANVDVLEGDPPGGPVVILEFATKQAAFDWYHSAEYKEVRMIREGVARASMYVMDRVV